MLDLLAREPRTFSELSRMTGVPKSSLHTIVSTLAQTRLIERQNHRLFMGFRTFVLGSGYRRLISTQEAFREVAQALSRELGETMHLGVRDGNEIIHVANVEGRKAIRYVAREGEKLPANATALGKVLLAYLPQQKVRALFPEGLPRLTPLTVASWPRFMRQLQEIRHRGYAVDLGEVDVELRCVAVPIVSADGPVAAFAIAAPAFRLTEERIPELARVAREAGTLISQKIGNFIHENQDFRSKKTQSKISTAI